MATDFPYVETNHYHYAEFTRDGGTEEVTYNSYMDWGLYLEEPVTVSAPKPNTYMVEVPGRNGSLDLTESAIGSVTYQDREMVFPFVCRKKRNEWGAIYQKLLNAVHGKHCKITCSDDPDYYYEGRVTVEEWGASGKMAFPEVRAVVRPFKIKKEPTVYTVKVEQAEPVKTTLKGKYWSQYQADSIMFFQTGPFKIDWSIFSAIVIRYRKNGTGTTVTVTDKLNQYDETENVLAEEYETTLTRAELENAGVDWNNISGVVVSGDIVAKSVVIKGVVAANAAVTVGASGKPVVPTITTIEALTMTVNGNQYSVTPGGWQNENVTVGEDETTFAFALADAGTAAVGVKVKISYQEEWL